MPDRRPSILQAAIERVGVRQGSRACSVLVSWHTARVALGDDWPRHGVEAQVQAYAAWWNVDERTGWRDLQRFRAAFPGESTPTRLVEAAQSAWDERRGVQGLGAVPLPV